MVQGFCFKDILIFGVLASNRVAAKYCKGVSLIFPRAFLKVFSSGTELAVVGSPAWPPKWRRALSFNLHKGAKLFFKFYFDSFSKPFHQMISIFFQFWMINENGQFSVRISAPNILHLILQSNFGRNSDWKIWKIPSPQNIVYSDIFLTYNDNPIEGDCGSALPGSSCGRVFRVD